MNRPRIAAFLLSPLAGALYIVALIMFKKGLWSQMFNGGLWNLLEDILGLASMVLFFAIIVTSRKAHWGYHCCAYFVPFAA